MCHACVDCGSPVVRKNPAKPWPHRCPGCKTTKQRQYWQSRRLGKARSARQCESCGIRPAVTPKRGPVSAFCDECRRGVRQVQSAARKAKAKRSGANLRHASNCCHCGAEFRSECSRKKYCSRECLQAARRATFSCQHCGVVTETSTSSAKSRRFCSKRCSNAGRSGPERKCVGCGREFRRRISEKFPHTGKGKYCTGECYLDHRWGKDRPRKAWSESVRARSRRNAVATSIRKKCKILGVPHDPECTREAVCERDGWVCQKCGVQCNREYIIDKKTRRVHPRNAEHDHIIPVTDKDSPGNVFPNSQCLCRKCNGKKSDTRWGQLRIDLEGSLQRWDAAVVARNRRNSRSSEEIPAVAH